jgi:hypothetical protein
MILFASDFKPYTESEIRRLQGGWKYEFNCFIAFLKNKESDITVGVISARLLRQMGRQCSPRHPKGFERFRTP